jgi:hypothetical protein
MRSKTTPLLAIILIVAVALPVTLMAGPAQADLTSWAQSNVDGFGSATNTRIWAMAEYKGCLYAGTRRVGGCQVWRYDGNTWGQANTNGFGDANNGAVFSLAVFGGYLYAGTENINGAELWRTAATGGLPYADWQKVNADGFGSGNNDSIDALAVYGSFLYAGTYNSTGGTEIWRTAGAGGPPFADWVRVNTPGFGSVSSDDCWSMTVFEGRLHVGIENDTTGCEVWSTAAAGGPPYADWVRVNTPGFGSANRKSVRVMVVKGSYLYAGVDNGSGGVASSIWRTSAAGGPPYSDWVNVAPNGFGYAGNVGVTSLVSDGSFLYAGTRNSTTGTEVWRSVCAEGPPFADWQQVNIGGYGNANNSSTFSLLFWNSDLYGCTGNDATGGEVWRNMSEFPSWYLAEGSTAWGFDEYITIENPYSDLMHAAITYLTAGGPIASPNVALAPRSQTTVNPRLVVGDQDFSAKVTCIEGHTIGVDRTMTWTGPGAASPEGHSSVGVSAPSTNWYLPEGSSDWGFESWLLIQNPNAVEVTCNVTYMIEGAPPQTLVKTVPANSRRTYNMEDDIGKRDASILVESNIPVIPERAMYRNNRREGHDSIGTATTAYDYLLAEGTTAWGFTTYVLVQNPNPRPTDVTVTYMTPGGPRPQAPFSMPANSRKTIRVNDVEPNVDLSTEVHGSLPIIAERAMYWNNGTGEACHDSIGMSAPHNVFFLPDGQTSDGRETWTLVQNPNGTPVQVIVRYMLATGGTPVVFSDTIPANSRKTYNMADAGVTGRAAILVESNTPGKTIVVERAMYWNTRGAGTDTIGCSLD